MRYLYISYTEQPELPAVTSGADVVGVHAPYSQIDSYGMITATYAPKAHTC